MVGEWVLLITLNHPNYTTEIVLNKVSKYTDEAWQAIIDGDAAKIPRGSCIQPVDGGESYEIRLARSREDFPTLIDVKIGRHIAAPAIAAALGLRAPPEGKNIKEATPPGITTSDCVVVDAELWCETPGDPEYVHSLKGYSELEKKIMLIRCKGVERWRVTITLTCPDYTTEITHDADYVDDADEVWQALIDGDTQRAPRDFLIEFESEDGESCRCISRCGGNYARFAVRVEISWHIIAPAIAEALGLRAPPPDGKNVKGDSS